MKVMGDNVVVDTLSRPPPGEINTVAASPAQVDYAAIADAQQACPDTNAAKKSSKTLQMVKFGDVQLLCDTSGPPPTAAHTSSTPTPNFHRLPQPGTPRH